MAHHRIHPPPRVSIHCRNCQTSRTGTFRGWRACSNETAQQYNLTFLLFLHVDRCGPANLGRRGNLHLYLVRLQPLPRVPTPPRRSRGGGAKSKRAK